MYWRVAICHLGIRGQICLGSDPEKMELERESLINKTKIKLLFEKNEVQRVLDDSWKYVKEYLTDITQKLEEIDEKYGAKGTRGAFKFYQMSVNTETDKIEIRVDVPEKDVGEFHRSYGDIEGAIKLLYSADRVYSSSSDPAKLILKWVKKLELEMED